MRRILIFVVTSLIPVFLLGQGSPVDKLFDKYAGQDGYTMVYITKYMFSMFAQMGENNPEEAEELGQVLGKLDNIKILAVDDEAAITGQVNFYDEIMKELPRDQYNELMVIKEKDSDVVFLAREKNGVIVELLLIAGGSSNSDNVLICIQGVIDLENISKLSQGLGIQGMEELEKIDQQP
jgi:hypothetical protein